MQSLFEVETGREHPGVVERGGVDALVAGLFEDIGTEDTGLIEGAGHRAGDGHIV